MRMIICLLRHGQTDVNLGRIFQGKSDTPLNENGIEQIKKASLTLKSKKIKWDQIFASPYLRAKESAMIVKEILSLEPPIITLDALRERDFGDAEGIEISDENYQKISRGEFLHLETEMMIDERAKNVLSNLIQQYYGQNLILVSHSHFIKALLRQFNPSITFQDRYPNGELSYLIISDDSIEVKKELD